MRIWPKGLMIAFMVLLQPLFAAEPKKKDPHGHEDEDREHEKKGTDEHADGGKDEHGHHGDKDGKESDSHEEHGHEHEDGDKDEHGHGHGHEESRNNVGPTKGVLEADEDEGFVLNEKAEKNFAIQKMTLTGNGSIVVPASALLYSGMEKQVYRYRNKRWKAVDIEIVRKDRGSSTIKSKDLAAGDSVAVTGVGFLKIVEQSVFGPQVEGHVH